MEYEQQYGSNPKVMVGCGCKTVKDVATFIRERRIEFVELAWADEMGLWHNEVVPVSELTFASLQEGVPTKDGRYLLPDPLSARIAPLTQPNTMHFTCNPPINRPSLKRKELSPGWIEMVSKKIMENDRRSAMPMDKGLNTDFIDERTLSPYPRSPAYAIPRSPNYSSPCSPIGSPGSPGSIPGSPNSLNSSGCVPGSPSSVSSDGLSSSGFIEWKLVRNDQRLSSSSPLIYPSSPNSDASGNGSVPGSPSLSPRSPQSPVPDIVVHEAEPGSNESKVPGKRYPHVPPLLRPRQIHPTKANKLGITKPTKKRRNTEHLYCRHCGTTETPEWRRGPDGRKSLCNACGLYFSKMIKRETMVVPQGRRVAIDALLNPHS